MGWCQTLLTVAGNPWILGGVGATGIGLKLLYSYSSYTFLPSVLTFSALWRTLMTTISGASSVLRTDLLKYAATATTFSGTLKYLFQGQIQPNTLIFTVLEEFYNKVILTVPNFVNGLSSLTEWIGTLSNGACSLSNNFDLFINGFTSLWISVAAAIFILWVWKKTWYDWRNKKMEAQEKYLIISLVLVVSVAAHGTEVLMQGLESGTSIYEMLQNLLQSFDYLETGNATNLNNSSS